MFSMYSLEKAWHSMASSRMRAPPPLASRAPPPPQNASQLRYPGPTPVRPPSEPGSLLIPRGPSRTTPGSPRSPHTPTPIGSSPSRYSVCSCVTFRCHTQAGPVFTDGASPDAYEVVGVEFDPVFDSFSQPTTQDHKVISTRKRFGLTLAL